MEDPPPPLHALPPPPPSGVVLSLAAAAVDGAQRRRLQSVRRWWKSGDGEEFTQIQATARLSPTRGTSGVGGNGAMSSPGAGRRPSRSTRRPPALLRACPS
uniref:Uncharacterized protein n=1 Tax=Oryza brachyantha TaxID=4533 RepID=J3MG23_ORYBR